MRVGFLYNSVEIYLFTMMLGGKRNTKVGKGHVGAFNTMRSAGGISLFNRGSVRHAQTGTADKNDQMITPLGGGVGVKRKDNKQGGIKTKKQRTVYNKNVKDKVHKASGAGGNINKPQLAKSSVVGRRAGGGHSNKNSKSHKQYKSVF